jgi:hypothetical protein
MLRAQAFEGLFTLVPILLVAVVSIVLRARSAKKRKQREGAAQAEGTQIPAAKPPAGPGPTPPPSTARGASRPSGRAIPPRRGRRETRTAPFPWQRETSDAASAPPGPLTPSPRRRAQAQLRDSYAYPPPLSPGEDGASAAAAVQPKGAPLPRPIVRPTVESRMAAERMASPKQEKSLRERMQALTKSDRPSAKAPAGGPSSIAAKLKKLPPLKRAVIWAELLGPPGGKQQ